MKIIDLLKSEKLSLSFEVFPPKTESTYDSVRSATEEIARLRPSFMSVTYVQEGEPAVTRWILPRVSRNVTASQALRI